MFDSDRSGSGFAPVSPPVPLERLEELVHDRGYLIAAPPPGGGDFAFCRPDGSPVPSCPPLPGPDGPTDAAHDADITPDMIIPPWYGERLDLDHAIYVCFANARTQEQKRAGLDPAPRGRATVYEPEDWPERIRQYREQSPGTPARP